MNIKYSRLNQVKGSLTMQKALSLAIYLKYKVGKNSTIRNCNPNKVQTLTGISSNTFRKYLPWMEHMGLVAHSGKRNQHLVILSLQSKNKDRNIIIDTFCFDSYKDVYRSLRTYIMLDIQRRKDYICQLLQTYHNPKNYKECKKVRKKVRKYVANGVIHDTDYHEHGISYQFIAKVIGCCKSTAQKVVNYAVDKGWCIKEQHWWRFNLPGVCYREVDGYTFTTMNYGYVIHANTYQLSPAVSASYRVGIYRG